MSISLRDLDSLFTMKKHKDGDISKPLAIQQFNKVHTLLKINSEPWLNRIYQNIHIRK
jgi:hypothetical protein